MVEPPASPIASFTLRGGDGTDLGALAEGRELAADVGAVEVRAEIAEGESVGSIRFALSGPVTREHTENYAPWELWGGRGSGAALGTGEYTLTATPYPHASLGGEALPALEVSFTVAEPGTSESRIPPRVTAPRAPRWTSPSP